MTGKELYEFGSFRLDIGDRRLFRDGQPIHLEPKVFDLLVVLVKSQGQLLKKEQLKKAIDVNSAAVLTRHVSVLRKTLGDGLLEQRKYIKTDWKSGYRFVTPVRKIVSDEMEAGGLTVNQDFIENPVQESLTDDRANSNLTSTSAQTPSAPTEKDAEPPRRSRRRTVLLMLILAGLIAAAAFWYKKRVEAEIRHVVQDSQIVETLQIYTNPEGFDKNLLTKYWLPEEQGGVEITRVKATVDKLLCEQSRYGKDAKLEQFSFRLVKVASFGFGKSAIVETEESWYLPKYKKDGSPVPQEAKNLYMKTTPKYELRKVGSAWLIIHTGVPRRRSLPCPSPTPSPAVVN